MSEKIKELRSPHGLAHLAFHMPIWLYRSGIGWVMEYRFLYLTHSGHKSGQPRYTVLEMVLYD